jgi:uncharacterized protein YndB with AHSA1/START domain
VKKVEAIIEIRTTPQQIIKAFTDLKMLEDWWHVERALVEKKAGGLYILAWNISEMGFGYVSSGTFKTYVPDKEIVVENLIYLNPERSFLGPMSLTVRATKAKELTSVYLCQDGYQSGRDWDWYYEAVKNAWPSVLQDLKKYLEK